MQKTKESEPEWVEVDRAEVDREIDKTTLSEFLHIKWPLDITNLSPNVQRIILGYLYGWHKSYGIGLHPQDVIHTMRFCKNDQEVVYISQDETTIHIVAHDINSQVNTALQNYDFGLITSIEKAEITPDGNTVAFALNDNTMRVFDRTKDLVYCIEVPDRVRALSFLKSNPKIVALSYAHFLDGHLIGALELWDWQKQLVLKQIGGRFNDLCSIKNSEKWDLSVVNFHSTRVHIRSIENKVKRFGANLKKTVLPYEVNHMTDFKKRIQTAQRGEGVIPVALDLVCVNDVVVSDNGACIAIHTGKSIEVFDLVKNKKIKSFDQKFSTYRAKDYPYFMRFSPHGDYLLIALLDKNIKIWNKQADQLILLAKQENIILDAQFSQDGRNILIAVRTHNGRRNSLLVFINQGMKLDNSLILSEQDKDQAVLLETPK